MLKFKSMMILPILLSLISSIAPLTPQARAVDLPISARHHNTSNYCTWSALDTLARTHNISALIGITRQRYDRNGGAFSDPGFDAAVRQELTSRGVKFEMREHGSFDRSLLEQFTASHGVVIGWKVGTPTMGCHSVVVTQYDDDAGTADSPGWVHYYDPSKPLDKDKQPKIWRVQRSFFDQYWMGGSIVVFGDSPGGDPLADEIKVIGSISTADGKTLKLDGAAPKILGVTDGKSGYYLSDGAGGFVRLAK